VIGTFTGGSKALVFRRQRADPSVHSPSQISILRILPEGASMATDPSLCTMDRYHAGKNPRYVYERLYVTLVSASRPFVDWFRASLFRLIGIHGSISERMSRACRPYWVLRYARRESGRLLPWIYYAASVPCLARKRARSEPFLRLAGTS
jgi:hypothetical protein